MLPMYSLGPGRRDDFKSFNLALPTIRTFITDERGLYQLLSMSIPIIPQGTHRPIGHVMRQIWGRTPFITWPPF